MLGVLHLDPVLRPASLIRPVRLGADQPNPQEKKFLRRREGAILAVASDTIVLCVADEEASPAIAEEWSNA
jgi:hypothetical protein